MALPSPRDLCIAAALALLSPGLAGTASAEEASPRGYAVQSHTPEGFKLPDGNGCAGEVARWQAVQANDYAGGNVSLKIYNQIQAEIAQASTLCEAGQDGAARKMVAESKRRHGYPQ